MGRKKFIDKKKSATFQLLARDSSDPNYGEGPDGDRVFIRVDNSSYTIPGFGDDSEPIDHSGDTHVLDDPNSIFADAPEDEDEDENGMHVRPAQAPHTKGGPLPDNVRREILELGFPDDGYNYLLHLREIKNSGSGSAYYENSKAKLDQLPNDVKAYDASRVHVPVVSDDLKDNSIYNIAAKTFGVRVQKVVDPDVAALLDDSDLSRFGSDVEDLDEDFVMQANLSEGQDVVANNENVVEELKLTQHHPVAFGNLGENESRSCQLEVDSERTSEKPRVRRLLDEQFDLLTLQEYGSESDGECDGSIAEEDECLAHKLSNTLKDHVKDEFDLDGKYKVPADLVHANGNSNSGEALESAEVIRRCAEYAEMYENENQKNDEMVIMEESSDESEVWDCETIVSTYSNLDNHPGKIETPGRPRKKKLAIPASTLSGVGSPLIALRGKEKLPVDYLPYSKKAVLDKVTRAPGSKSCEQMRKPHGGESKEEKKERKAAVKEERREARRAKKELKGIYRCEAQRAQKVAAFTGPSAIHLM